jgi:hypothetical protein
MTNFNIKIVSDAVCPWVSRLSLFEVPSLGVRD